MTVSINFQDSGLQTLRMFRTAPASVTESIEHYFIEVVLPHFCNEDALTRIRCSVSGFQIAAVLNNDLRDSMISAIYALGVNKLNDPLNPPTPAGIADAVERVMDHIAMRTIYLARPAASIAFTNDSFSLGKLDPRRQMAVLLNQLLFDAGEYRDKFIGLEDKVERIRNASQVADVICADEWGTDSHDLLAALIELDAKYRIIKLRFTNKEMAALIEIRDSKQMDFVNLLYFVTKLIIYRDQHSEVEVTPARWTQDSYRDAPYLASTRERFSNLVVPPKPAKVRVKTSMGMRKAAAPKTPEQQAKANIKESMDKTLAAALASFKF